MSDGCAAPKATAEPAPDSLVWPFLVGDFALVQVDTNGQHATVSQRVRLRLEWNDSVRRWTREGLWTRRPMPPTDRPVAGSIGKGGWMDSVIVERRVLTIGCQSCDDASPDRLTVVQVNRDGFRGWWANAGTGLIRADVATDGPRVSAGYFCARRLGTH